MQGVYPTAFGVGVAFFMVWQDVAVLKRFFVHAVPGRVVRDVIRVFLMHDIAAF